MLRLTVFAAALAPTAALAHANHGAPHVHSDGSGGGIGIAVAIVLLAVLILGLLRRKL